MAFRPDAVSLAANHVLVIVAPVHRWRFTWWRIPSGRMAGAFRTFPAGGAAFRSDEVKERRREKLPFLMFFDCGRDPGAN